MRSWMVMLALVATSASAARDAAGGGAPAQAPAPPPPLTDARIAAIAVMANKIDVEAARLAMRKSKNVAVKNFASDMISDHTSASKEAVALAKKLGVSPEESAFSRDLAKDGKSILESLQPLTGREFDVAYAESEVAYHQRVLGALDDKLIKSAQDPELKALLQGVREMVRGHLDHAADLYESLSNK